MSDATARTVRLVKAQGIRDAAAKLLDNVYSPPSTTWEMDYNFAMRDAANFLIEAATELESK